MGSFQYEHYPDFKMKFITWKKKKKEKKIKWNIIGKFQAGKIGWVHDVMSLQGLHKYVGEIICSPTPTAFA